MLGVRAEGVHDIALVDVALVLPYGATAVYAHPGWWVDVHVTVRNEGDFNETFNVTAYYSFIAIETQSVINLAPGAAATLTFHWVISGVSPTLTPYSIGAEAGVVSGETDITDNTLNDGAVLVKMPGDTNGDGKIDYKDLYWLAVTYGSSYPLPQYNPNYDFNCDGKIDYLDLFILAINYGKTYTYSRLIRVAQSNSSRPLCHSYGHKLFETINRYILIFYSTHEAIYYVISKDKGVTWSSPTYVRNNHFDGASGAGWNFYAWLEYRNELEYVHYVYNSETAGTDPDNLGTYYCRGILNGTNITWSDEQLFADWYHSSYSCGVCVNTDGYPFVIYGDKGDLPYGRGRIKVSKSSTNDGTFVEDSANGFPYTVNTDPQDGHTYSGQVFPLLNNEVAIVYAASGSMTYPVHKHPLKFRKWSPSGGIGAEENYSSTEVTSNYEFAAGSDDAGNVHAVYRPKTTGYITFRKRVADGTYENEQTVESEKIASYPRISIVSQQVQRIYWIHLGDSKIYYRERIEGVIGDRKEPPFDGNYHFHSLSDDELNAYSIRGIAWSEQDPNDSTKTIICFGMF